MINVSVIDPVPLPAALLIPETTGRVQVKLAPGVLLVGVYLNSVLLHIDPRFKVLVNTGIGFTTTATV